MLAHSFLIESPSKLLVTRTGIKVQSSSIFGWIRPLILELLALEWRKFHTFELEYLCLHLFSVVFYSILFILAGDEDMHKILDEFEFWPDQTADYRVSCPWGLKYFPLTYNGNMVSPCWFIHFWSIIIKVAGNQDRHKSSDKFDFGFHGPFMLLKWDLTLAHWTREQSLPFGLLVHILG